MLQVQGHSHLQPENPQIRQQVSDKMLYFTKVSSFQVKKGVPQHIANTILKPVPELEYLSRPQLSKKKRGETKSKL